MALGTSDTLACHGSMVCFLVCLFPNPSVLPTKNPDPSPTLQLPLFCFGVKEQSPIPYHTPTSPLEKA